MNTRQKLPTTLLIILVTMSVAKGAIFIQFLEQGPDVVATFTGSINTAGLSSPTTNQTIWNGDGALGLTAGSTNVIFGGSVPYSIRQTPNFEVFSDDTGFRLSTGTNFADVVTGDVFGVNSTNIYLPDDYVSGTTLNGSMTFLNKSYSDMNVKEGSGVMSWGTGGDADSVTLVVGAVPEPHSALLVAIGVGITALYRRNR